MKHEQLQLATGNHKDTRRALDYYPTPIEVTVALMDFLVENDLISKEDRVWECACGDGIMAEVIKVYCPNVYATDIRTDTGYGFAGVDYLNDRMPRAENFDAVITNPPFNRSEEFILKSLKDARLSAMLVKSQYWHAKKRAELFRNNPPAYVLPLTWRPDFVGGERGGSPTMEVQWTVWIRGIKDTRYRLLMKPEV